MYRIHYNHDGGFFCIQILVWGFIWVTVRRHIGGPGTPVKEVIKFMRLEEARKHVKDTGLSALYQDKSKDKFRNYMQAGNRVR